MSRVSENCRCGPPSQAHVQRASGRHATARELRPSRTSRTSTSSTTTWRTPRSAAVAAVAVRLGIAVTSHAPHRAAAARHVRARTTRRAASAVRRIGRARASATPPRLLATLGPLEEWSDSVQSVQLTSVAPRRGRDANYVTVFVCEPSETRDEGNVIKTSGYKAREVL